MKSLVKKCGRKIFIPDGTEGTYKCSTCGHEEKVNNNKNKTDYKKLYKENSDKYDLLLERYINMSQTFGFIRNLINVLDRVKKYNEVYDIMSKYVIDDIRQRVLNNISYEDKFYEKK